MVRACERLENQSKARQQDEAKAVCVVFQRRRVPAARQQRTGRLRLATRKAHRRRRARRTTQGGKRRGEGGAHRSGSWRTEASQWRVDAEAGRGRAVPRGDVDVGDRGVGVVQGLQQRRPPRRARLRSGVVLLFWPFPVIPPSSPVLPSSLFLSSTLGSLCFGVEAAAQRGKEPRGD